MENALRAVLCYKGERGYSAYEIAVQNGFIGSEKDWLAQLGITSYFTENSVVHIATANQTSFDIPTSYTSGSMIDMYVNGFKLNANEYTVDESTMKINLAEALDEGAVVEIVVKEMGTNKVAIKHHNSVSNMKNDNTLEIANLVHTLGYYEVNDGGAADYLIREKAESDVEDNGSIHFLDNGLVAELIIGDSFNLAQIGGKANDNTFDNSPYLEQGLKILSINNGGKFIIPNGNWHCKTPIVVNDEIYGATIEGESRGVDGEKGVTLSYTGSGMFITFNEKTNHFTLQDFSVELSDTAYFIQFNYTFHKGIMKNIHVSGGLGCIDINTGTYPLFDNIGYTTGVPNAEYGLRIGAGSQIHTTEFVYIERSSFDFQRIGSGSGIEVLNMNGGLWVSHCDICNTKGSAIKIHNKRGSTIAYLNFDNNNISGCKIGYDLYAETGSLAGIYISNQRISCNFENIDERFIYTNAGSGLTVDIKMNGMYLRSRTGGVNPKYVFELLKLSPDSIVTFDGGEKFDIPIYLQRAIKKLYDFRMNYNRVLTHTNYQKTGDYEIPLSNYKCLELEGETFYHPGQVTTDEPVGYVKTTYPNGIPTANIRIKEGKIPQQRLFIHVSDELQQENHLFY